MADGRLVVVHDPARGGETVVRRLVERDGRRTLCALDERCPERTIDAGNDPSYPACGSLAKFRPEAPNEGK